MKNLFLLLSVMILFAGCVHKLVQTSTVCHTTENTDKLLEQSASSGLDDDTVWGQPAERDSVFFTYIEPVENYRITGVFTAPDLNEWDTAFVRLTFRHNKTHKEFTVLGGRMNWSYFLNVNSIPSDTVKLHYPNIVENGVISAPDNVPFFFADLDFDGEKELITDNSAYAGTQRGVGIYKCIYKIIDGEPQDVTNEFIAKSEIFDRMDEFFFMIVPSRKEFILYESNGAYCSSWQVHKFINGEYFYDRHVHYIVRDLSTKNYEIAVTSPQGDTIKLFTVDEAAFNKDMWAY